MSPSEKLHSGCLSDCLSQLGCPIRISSSSRVFLLPWRFWWRKMKVKSYLNVDWKLNSQFEKTNCSNLCHWSCPSPNLPHIQDLNIQLWPGSSGHIWGLSSCGGDQVHIWAPSSVFSHHLLLLAHWCQHQRQAKKRNHQIQLFCLREGVSDLNVCIMNSWPHIYGWLYSISFHSGLMFILKPIQLKDVSLLRCNDILLGVIHKLRNHFWGSR